MYPYTEEQLNIINSNSENIKAVNAFSGTGKTSTSVAYALQRKNKSIKVISYNKSLQLETQEKFKQQNCTNATVQTSHSMAWGYGVRYKHRLGNLRVHDIIDIVDKANKNKDYSTAYDILNDLQEYMSSDKPNIDSFYQLKEKSGKINSARSDGLEKVWKEISNVYGKSPVPHDFYLKLYALSNPKIKEDIIILDENQDVTPLLFDLVSKQTHAQLLFIGDKHQSIYRYRGAVNAMEDALLKADSIYPLTKSFRFGQPVANYANVLLRTFKGESLNITGTSDSLTRIDYDKPYTVLGRTNSGLLKYALTVSQNKNYYEFMGNVNDYRIGQLESAYHLYKGSKTNIKDPFIKRFSSWQDLVSTAKELEDVELQTLVTMINEWKDSTLYNINTIKANAVDRTKTPNITPIITFTTGHKSKGLEFKQVLLNTDFSISVKEFIKIITTIMYALPSTSAKTDEEIIKFVKNYVGVHKFNSFLDEINLLYVAITRSQQALSLPPDVAWLISYMNQCHNKPVLPSGWTEKDVKHFCKSIGHNIE